LLLQGTGAMERGDFAAAVKPLEAFWKAWPASPDLQTTYSDSQCNLCLAYGMAGRVDDAAALFKNAGPWSRCAAFHGDVLAHAGDFAGAARIWAESLRLVPDLPHVYLHRGRFALGRGDIAAAISDFAAATSRAPHYADPLKSWGDALSGQGLWKASIEKYDEALKYAPAWAGLHQARSVAALKL
jgi:tetratricopeptide (TPR) repeat protein